MPLRGRAGEESADTTSQDHGLPRFFFAAGVALVHRRDPWHHACACRRRRVDPRGRLRRAHDHQPGATHITIVGAGTISLTGLLYYILPRLGRRPLYSQHLTNVSFWFTVIGVFGFYVAMTADRRLRGRDGPRRLDSTRTPATGWAPGTKRRWRSRRRSWASATGPSFQRLCQRPARQRVPQGEPGRGRPGHRLAAGAVLRGVGDGAVDRHGAGRVTRCCPGRSTGCGRRARPAS